MLRKRQSGIGSVHWICTLVTNKIEDPTRLVRWTDSNDLLLLLFSHVVFSSNDKGVVNDLCDYVLGC